MHIICADENIEKEAFDIFKENIKRKGFSYTDAVTVATMRTLEISNLLTFDIMSFAGIVPNIIGPGYMASLSEDERRRILSLASEIEQK